MLEKARKLSTQFAQKISEIANATEAYPKQFTVLTTSLLFQTIMISSIIDDHKAGSKDGAEMIKLLYATALKDALERWEKPDIKGLGPQKYNH